MTQANFEDVYNMSCPPEFQFFSHQESAPGSSAPFPLHKQAHEHFAMNKYMIQVLQMQCTLLTLFVLKKGRNCAYCEYVTWVAPHVCHYVRVSNINDVLVRLITC